MFVSTRFVPGSGGDAGIMCVDWMQMSGFVSCIGKLTTHSIVAARV